MRLRSLSAQLNALFAQLVDRRKIDDSVREILPKAKEPTTRKKTIKSEIPKKSNGHVDKGKEISNNNKTLEENSSFGAKTRELKLKLIY